MKIRSKNLFSSVLLATFLAALLVSPAFVGTSQAQDGGPAIEDSMAGDELMDRRARWRKQRGRHGGAGKMDKIGRLGSFLKIVTRMTKTVKDPHQALGLAALSVKEHYKKAGKPADAIPELQQFLGSTTNQAARNVILFNIRQIYEETKQNDKALEISKQIITENLKAAK